LHNLRELDITAVVSAIWSIGVLKVLLQLGGVESVGVDVVVVVSEQTEESQSIVVFDEQKSANSILLQTISG